MRRKDQAVRETDQVVRENQQLQLQVQFKANKEILFDYLSPHVGTRESQCDRAATDEGEGSSSEGEGGAPCRQLTPEDRKRSSSSDSRSVIVTSLYNGHSHLHLTAVSHEHC